MTPAISAFVITKNEAVKIAACIESLRWVDEIVVVDDFSTDGTPDICRRLGATVHQHAFTGFRDQKSHAMSLTRNDWVLELDADERVSPEMRRSIEAITGDDSDRHAAFSFPRLTRFWGCWIRHGSLYPDRKVRLYHKQRGAWTDRNIHEAFVPSGPVGGLQGDIIHEQDLDLVSYLQRTIRYSDLSAGEMHREGRSATWVHVCLRPAYTFLYRFLFRLGFLDGMHGFLIAAVGAAGTFVKYARLRELGASQAKER